MVTENFYDQRDAYFQSLHVLSYWNKETVVNRIILFEVLWFNALYTAIVTI